MEHKETLEQLARLQAKLDAFPDFILVPPKPKYVGLKNDGEVELEEIGRAEENEEEVYE